MTWSPIVTCPSAISTALLSLRTHRTVVPCICALPWLLRIPPLYSGDWFKARLGTQTRKSGLQEALRRTLQGGQLEGGGGSGGGAGVSLAAGFCSCARRSCSALSTFCDRSKAEATISISFCF